MTDDAADALADEFDTAAGWTADAIGELGPDHAVPAASRGSGSPAALAWLAESLDLRRDVRLLDSGAGIGGPAAWAVDRYGVRSVCAEPMPRAVAACRRLFGLPAVVATSQRLPFGPGTFDASWSLGVLSTTEAKGAMLAELRRVLRPGGRLGLLVYVADGEVPDPPAGDSFPTYAALHVLVTAAGFDVIETAEADAPAPRTWAERADAADDVVRRRHGDDHRWRRSSDQAARMGQLIADGIVRPLLLSATVAQPRSRRRASAAAGGEGGTS